jgi:hypothetical protein
VDLARAHRRVRAHLELHPDAAVSERLVAGQLDVAPERVHDDAVRAVA